MSAEKEAEEDSLDPRIQVELERLNTCTNEINRLETELDEVNGIFRTKLAEGIQKLHQFHDKLGKCIDKAKPYYLARQIARQAQLETQKAAVQYQRAVSTHQAAKETIRLAEQRFLSKQDEWEFDAAWQEMLNHATMKVMEAETNKAKSEQEHQMKAARFALAKEELQTLEKQLRSVVAKSRSYFELKELFHKELEVLKGRTHEIQKKISYAKSGYAESLHNLEVISEQIHLRRRLLRPREPGVGAERETVLPDILLDDMDEIAKGLNCSGDLEDGVDKNDTTLTSDDGANISAHSEEGAASAFVDNIFNATPTSEYGSMKGSISELSTIIDNSQAEQEETFS